MSKNIVIVGAGLAGLSAALQAVENKCKVTLISSMPSERSQSVMAEGGINAALNTKGEDDSTQEHFEDTIKAGCNLSDPNAVFNMTQAAPELVKWLHNIGVQFNTWGDDELDLRNFGGQKKKRTAFSKSDTGKQIMTAMIDAVRRYEVQEKIKRFNHHSFQTLLLNDKFCYGCVIRDNYTQEIKIIHGDAVIIATGGIHGLFGNTTGSLINTGEVSAELFSLGVLMANLEMIQYHPTTVVAGNKKILISEAARGEGARLFTYRNNERWYFMEEKYPDLGNLMPRDITAREIYKTSKESPVYLDMTEFSKDLIELKLKGLEQDCKTYLNTDIRKQPVQVEPGIHYFMGGIYVDEKHRASVNHLYAAGECCAQYHGANRLGGNSLLGALYGGRVAAQTACEEALSENVEIKNDSKGLSGDKVFSEVNMQTDFQQSSIQSQKNKINQIMQKSLGVIRSQVCMEGGLKELRQIENPLSVLGQAVIMSAMERKESRGAHYREDFPEKNDDFEKTTVAAYDGKKIYIRFEKISERRLEK